MNKIYCFFPLPCRNHILKHTHQGNHYSFPVVLGNKLSISKHNMPLLINVYDIFLVFLALQTFSIIGVDLFYQFLGGHGSLSESNHQVLSVSKIPQILALRTFILLCLHLSFKCTQFPSHYDSDIPYFSNFHHFILLGLCQCNIFGKLIFLN